MSSITFRLSDEARERLRSKANGLGVSESDLLREMIERELEEKPLGARAGHLKGSIALRKPRQAWRSSMRKRNWRA